MLLVCHLYHVNAGGFQLGQVVAGVDGLVFVIAGNVGRPFGVWLDQANVERFDVGNGVFLAEVGFWVELVGGEGEGFDVAGADLELGGFAGSISARGDDGECFGFHHSDALAGLTGPGFCGGTRPSSGLVSTKLRQAVRAWSYALR